MFGSSGAQGGSALGHGLDRSRVQGCIGFDGGLVRLTVYLQLLRCVGLV